MMHALMSGKHLVKLSWLQALKVAWDGNLSWPSEAT